MSHPARNPLDAANWPVQAWSDVNGSGSEAEEAETCLAEVAAKVGASATRDELLHAVRRIDWRFLMPRPVLGHVALLGDDDPDLVRALRWFSASLSLLDLDWSFPPLQAPRFDQVVLRSGRSTGVQNAAALVEPGGTLYWEIERGGPVRSWTSLFIDVVGRVLHAVRPGHRRISYEPLSLRTIRRRLERAGFEEIRWHWHRPGFRDALDIVPLRSDAVLDHVLGKHTGRVQGRIKRALGRFVHRMGALHIFAPCLSVMATRKA
jgi:hypothetical protein